MDQTQLAAQISPWLTPVVVLSVFGLIWRSMLRLEDRLGKRIDESNRRTVELNESLGKRIDELNESLGKRIDELNESLGKRIDESNSRIDELNESLGKRIDESNRRTDELNESLGKRIDESNRRTDGLDGRLRTIESTQAEIKGKLDFVEAYILGRNDTRTAAAE